MIITLSGIVSIFSVKDEPHNGWIVFNGKIQSWFTETKYLLFHYIAEILLQN